MTAPTAAPAGAGMAEFERTTSRWGRITMILALLLSLACPIALVLFGDLGVTGQNLWLAFLAVGATFVVLWIIEPVTYFPILGPAAMYQAFLIGNISNKLLPAAIVAQDSVGAKPGSTRGDLAAVMAICGAAIVHLTSLLVFVGLLGTWLLSVVPQHLIEVARLYILPALIGAVIVQSVVAMRQPRPTLFALGFAVVIQFGIIPLAPAVELYATVLNVALTIALSWFFRSRDAAPPEPPGADPDPERGAASAEPTPASADRVSA